MHSYSDICLPKLNIANVVTIIWKMKAKLVFIVLYPIASKQTAWKIGATGIVTCNLFNAS